MGQAPIKGAKLSFLEGVPVNEEVAVFMRKQNLELKAFAGFDAPPAAMSDDILEEAVLELVGRFDGISIHQLLAILKPWVHRPDAISVAVGYLLFDKRLTDRLCGESIHVTAWGANACGTTDRAKAGLSAILAVGGASIPEMWELLVSYGMPTEDVWSTVTDHVVRRAAFDPDLGPNDYLRNEYTRDMVFLHGKIQASLDELNAVQCDPCGKSSDFVADIRTRSRSAGRCMKAFHNAIFAIFPKA